MGRFWRPLPVAPHADVPPLLVAAAFDAASSSYSVAVTDLARIWSESLDRRGICMRAFRENTTIDPSYDSEQMGVFLGKIRSALDVQGDPDSSLALASSGDDLVLHVSCALPGGLPPLEWPLHLTLASGPSLSVSSSLVRPLVKDRARSQRSTAALMAALHQKDAVIAKLVDKLDAVGAGAESAFPSLLPSSGGSSARRAGASSRVSRADMERRIKGLAPFDEAAFRRQCRQQEDARDDDASTASLISTFGELPCGEADSLAEDKPWWQSLGSGKVALTRIASATDSQNTLQGEGQSRPSPRGEEDEDGFQTTDPVAGAPSPTPARTRDTDTLGTSSKSSKPKGLGKIGAGKKKVETKEEKEEKEEKKEREEEYTAPIPASLPVDVDEDATASEAEAENETAEKEKEKEEEKKGKEREETKAEEDRLETVATVRPKSARGGLGRIGGKKEKEEKEADKQPESEPETDESDSAKRKAASKSPAAAASKTPPWPPAIAETKRAEILQQAVAKNAAPVRKKRKF